MSRNDRNICYNNGPSGHSLDSKPVDSDDINVVNGMLLLEIYCLCIYDSTI